MKRSRLGLLATLLLALALILAACGGGGTAEQTATEPDTGEAAPVEEPAGEEAAPAEDTGAAAESASGTCEVTAIVGAGQDLEFLSQIVPQFEAEHPNITVDLIAGPESTTDRLGQYLQDFASQRGDFDVLNIDVIWPGDIAQHLIDLSPYIDEAAVSEHFPAIVQNNTVDGELVAIPWFTDAPLLYYRADLLEKYGYDGPPETWTELEEMAATIQEGERADNQDFQGFVWQGDAYEGLTCDGLEFVASSGGGTIVSPDKVITINNENAISAIEMAAGWVGTISPTGVTGFKEEDSRNIWHAGNAAFMRNWPYAWGLSFESEALCNGEIDAETGRCADPKFWAAPLPRGEGSDTGAACLGGWQLAVSRYSQCPAEAAELAVFLTSPEVQKQRAIELSLIPTIASLYDDPEVAAVVPPNMLEVLQNATPRPSTATAPNYNEVSTLFFTAVHSVLTGQEDAEDALAVLELDLQDLLGYETGAP